jgi:hypothetical protein
MENLTYIVTWNHVLESPIIQAHLSTKRVQVVLTNDMLPHVEWIFDSIYFKCGKVQ